MVIDLNFFRQGIWSVLEKNPNVHNSDLSGAIRARIINFKGHIQISDLRVHSFQSDGYEGIRKPAKMVYVSPYCFCMDLLASIRRIFTGVTFPPSAGNRDLLSDLHNGRRITIFCSLDGQEAEAVTEVDQKSLHVRLCEAVFGNYWN